MTKKNKKRYKKIYEKLKKKSINLLFRIRGQRPNRTYENKYYCNSRCYKAVFSKILFYNVNFRRSIITKTSFKKSNLIGVDFWNANLKGSNFSEANLENVIFVNTKLDYVNFKNTVFNNTYFVNTNLDKVKNLNINLEGIIILKKYPTIELSTALKDVLLDFKHYKNFYKTKILHLSQSKLNKFNIFILLKHFSEEELITKLTKLKENKKRINTLNHLVETLKKI